ncbi:MAG: dihydrofolate reductase family protein [Chloroflexota bacterium]
MAKVVVWMNPSLDGYISREDGALDWQSVDEDIHRYFNEKARQLSAFLHGRRMYDLMSAFWPTPEALADSDVMAEFAKIWTEKPKLMFSRTVKTANWNTRVVNENIGEEVARLKQQPGGDLAVGGAKIAASLQKLGLIDEYHLFVQPVAIGRGVPMFPEDSDVKLRLLESHAFKSGVVFLRYETIRDP